MPRIPLFIVMWVSLYIMCDTMYRVFRSEKPKRRTNNFHYSGVLYYILDVIPNRLCEWWIGLTSAEFHETGLILYCGPQGEGKTYAMCHEVTKLLCKYPDMKIMSNIYFMPSDYRLEDWKPLVSVKNGDKGIAYIFDEISLWWNARFRDLPPEVLQELVQNRKNHRVLFGTCQSISMCDKQIRLQASQFRNCHCFFGAFILCTCWRPVFDFDGDLIDKKFLGLKFYIQDDAIRYSYDTYELVERLAKTGFNYEKPQEVTVKVKELKNGKTKKL